MGGCVLVGGLEQFSGCSILSKPQLCPVELEPISEFSYAVTVVPIPRVDRLNAVGISEA